VALVALAACDGDPTNTPDVVVDRVEVDPSEVSLLVGDTIRLSARAFSADGEVVTGLPVTWASQTPDLAGVLPLGTQGRVSAARSGAAIITATVGGKTGEAEVDIANPAPAALSLEPATMGVGGASFTMTVRGTGFVPDSRIQWNGADRSTTFDGPDQLRAWITAADIAAKGSIEVRVVSPTPGGGVSGSLAFTVTDPTPPGGTVASVEIQVDSVVLAEGAFAQLTATARDASGGIVEGRFVYWTSSAPDVASLDALGGVTGIRSGRSTITARVDGVSTSIPARVWADYPYELVYSGWDGTDPATMRIYGADLGDTLRARTRIGPDAPSAGPVPSPDGSRLAYLMELGGGVRALMVANASGADAVELHLTTDVGCGTLTWSPDGQHLAFACRIGDADLDIWVVDADGENLVNITDGHDGKQDWPSWSPTLPGGGSRIAYAQYVNGEPRIWTMKPDGSDARQVTAGMDWQPAWSPDGTTIAFQRTGVALFGDIWLVDAEGGNERALVGAYLPGPQDSPAWSPDGRLVAFGSTHEGYGSGETLRRQIYTVWADGSKLARRTHHDLAIGSAAWRVR
jgi:uncharacterized protein YjdB